MSSFKNGEKKFRLVRVLEKSSTQGGDELGEVIFQFESRGCSSIETHWIVGLHDGTLQDAALAHTCPLIPKQPELIPSDSWAIDLMKEAPDVLLDRPPSAE